MNFRTKTNMYSARIAHSVTRKGILLSRRAEVGFDPFTKNITARALDYDELHNKIKNRALYLASDAFIKAMERGAERMECPKLEPPLGLINDLKSLRDRVGVVDFNKHVMSDDTLILDLDMCYADTLLNSYGIDAWTGMPICDIDDMEWVAQSLARKVMAEVTSTAIEQFHDIEFIQNVMELHTGMMNYYHDTVTCSYIFGVISRAHKTDVFLMSDNKPMPLNEGENDE